MSLPVATMGLMKKRIVSLSPFAPLGRQAASEPRTFEHFRSRQFAHLNRVDAMVAWNSALTAAIREVGSRPDVDREKVIDLLASLQADVF